MGPVHMAAGVTAIGASREGEGLTDAESLAHCCETAAAKAMPESWEQQDQKH